MLRCKPVPRRFNATPTQVRLRQLPDDVVYQVTARAPLDAAAAAGQGTPGLATKAEGEAEAEAEADAAALRDYFNLSTSLSQLAPGWCAACERYASVHALLPGARMLRQDPVECLFQVGGAGLVAGPAVERPGQAWARLPHARAALALLHAPPRLCQTASSPAAALPCTPLHPPPTPPHPPSSSSAPATTTSPASLAWWSACAETTARRWRPRASQWAPRRRRRSSRSNCTPFQPWSSCRRPRRSSCGPRVLATGEADLAAFERDGTACRQPRLGGCLPTGLAALLLAGFPQRCMPAPP